MAQERCAVEEPLLREVSPGTGRLPLRRTGDRTRDRLSRDAGAGRSAGRRTALTDRRALPQWWRRRGRIAPGFRARIPHASWPISTTG